MAAACRSCRAPGFWVVVRKSGKRMLVDPEPVEGGNVEIVGRTETEYGTVPTVVIHAKGDLPMPGMGGKRYRPHYATCPDAAKHRKQR